MSCARAIPVAALLALAGCAVSPSRSPIAVPWPQQRAALQALPSFDLRGRVAVLAGAEGFNGGLRWQQDHAHSHLRIEGPLGSGALSIDSDGERLSLATSRGEQLDGEAARAELEHRLGFALPLSSLRYWIVGVPDPGAPANEVLDAEQRLAALEQDGWRILYSLYVGVEGSWLPKRLTLERAGARVRLIVDRWDL